MAFQVGAFQSNAFQGAAAGAYLAATESGEDVFVATLTSEISATLAATEAGSDVATLTADVLIIAVLAVGETGADAFVGVGPLAMLRAREDGTDVFAGEGDSDGQIVVILRDEPASYLLELSAAHGETGEERTFYFSSDGFTSLPGDIPANMHYAERLKVPGNYERSLYSSGTTSGDISVGAGIIELNNNDGALDELRDYAFDGYATRILSVARLRPLLADAKAVFTGTVEQVELSWDRAKIRIRDRLADLSVAVQTALFAGTTVAGGMNEAEGTPDDLKGQPKPLAFGAPAQVVPAAGNSFDLIYNAGADGLTAMAEVRDKGVLIAATGSDYSTVAALRTATIAEGRYSTALNLGLFRLGSSPQGQVSCAPVVGSNAAARTAGQLARRMLLRKGFVEGERFLASDVVALDAANDAEIGYWIGTDEEQSLDGISRVLGSIGATIVPDRLGVYRMFRHGAPSGFPTLVLTRSEIIEAGARGIQLLATGDEGRGVPAWQVTVKYRRNWSVMTHNELDLVNVDDAFKSFAPEEWRSAVAKDDDVKAIHKLAPELTFETYLLHEMDAIAEASRLLALHSVRRDRFQVTCKSYLAENVDFGKVVRLQLDRFGLNDGKDFAVIGIAENQATGNTTLDLWG